VLLSNRNAVAGQEKSLSPGVYEGTKRFEIKPKISFMKLSKKNYMQFYFKF
jgi:hypothetical protein